MQELDHNIPVRLISSFQNTRNISVSFEKISKKFEILFSSVKNQAQDNKLLVDYAIQLEQRILGTEKFSDKANDKEFFVKPYGTLATLKIKTKSDNNINYLSSSFRALKRTENLIDRDLKRFSRSDNEKEKILILDAISEIDAELDHELYLISKKKRKNSETLGTYSERKYVVSMPQITGGKGSNNEVSERNKIIFTTKN